MNKRYAFRIQNSLELKVNDRTYDDSTNMKTYQNTDKSLISTLPPLTHSLFHTHCLRCNARRRSTIKHNPRSLTQEGEAVTMTEQVNLKKLLTTRVNSESEDPAKA